MKKFLLGALILACFGFAFAADMPAFTGEDADKAILLTVNDFKGARDKLVLQNQATNDALVYRFYFWHPMKKTWVEEKPMELEHFSHSSMFGRFGVPGLATVGVPIKNYKWLALVPVAEKEYNYNKFVYNGDLYVSVLPKDSSFNALGKDATEIDTSAIKAKTKDCVKFVSKTDKASGSGFYIFGDSGNGYELVGSAYLKQLKDEDRIAPAISYDLRSYSKVAIVSTDGKSHKYSVAAKSNDLYVFVED